MKNFILLLFGLLMFAVAKPQYVDKASVINSINANVKRAPATPLRGDTLNAILNGIMSFAGAPPSTPLKFGVNDAVMGQDRYMDIKDHQFYYDYDGNKGNANYVQFGHQGYKSFDVYFQDLGNSFIWAESYTDSAGAALYSGGIDGTANIFVHDSIAEISSAKHGKGSNLIMTGASTTLKRSNDNIPKNIITSINDSLADINGNINIAAGGAPMRFGIEDSVVTGSRYLNMGSGDNSFNFSLDGNLNKNFLKFGTFNGSQNLDNLITSSDYVRNSTGYRSEIWNSGDEVYLFAAQDSLNSIFDIYQGVVNIMCRNPRGLASSLVLNNEAVTIKRNNDYIAKNIITSINNQLADVNGNINSPQFTIAQRNALPVPSAGFTAFITDGVANDASVGVNQSWNGTIWKNNW